MHRGIERTSGASPAKRRRCTNEGIVIDQAGTCGRCAQRCDVGSGGAAMSGRRRSIGTFVLGLSEWIDNKASWWVRKGQGEVSVIVITIADDVLIEDGDAVWGRSWQGCRRGGNARTGKLTMRDFSRLWDTSTITGGTFIGHGDVGSRRR